MLTYLLAIVVGLGSFSLYMAAFFFPEVHRKYDLIWSGVGMFYALVLWVCAGRITGGVLLGQVASVALLSWFGWQTLKLRREQTPTAQQTQLPEAATSASEVVQLMIQQLRANLQQSADRSPLAAQLNRTIDRLEEGWIGLSSWFKALTVSLTSPESNPTSLTSNSQKTVPSREPSAEWAELEPESYPDLDTIDGTSAEPSYRLDASNSKNGEKR
ncbi:MAG: Ycf66 family protein [Leptolyngbya sp. IPPAS B-1204]|nr:MAG: hypothetical protein EDM05_23555 [Leptolyngbya sp. IPPAS B-1204]